MSEDIRKEIARQVTGTRLSIMKELKRYALGFYMSVFSMVFCLGLGFFIGNSGNTNMSTLANIDKNIKSLKSQVYHSQNKIDQMLDSLAIKYNARIKYGR